MRFSHLPLLATLALNALVCRAAEAQCDLANFRFENVPAHRKMMKRTIPTTLASGVKSFVMPLSPKAAAPVMSTASRPLVSALKKARMPPSPPHVVAQQSASLADELKFMVASGKAVEDAVAKQQAKVLEAKTSLLRAQRSLKQLKRTGSGSDEIAKAQRDADSASAFVKAQQEELGALTVRLNSGSREIAAKQKELADLQSLSGRLNSEVGETVATQGGVAKASRRVGFKTPQIAGATKAEQEMVEAQLKVKELTKNLEVAEATLLLSTPAAQRSLSVVAKQTAKVDDAQKRLAIATSKLQKLENQKANFVSIALAQRATSAASKALKAEGDILTKITEEVDPKLMRAIAKQEGIAARFGKAPGARDRLLDDLEVDATVAEKLARKNGEAASRTGPAPGIFDFAKSNVVEESVAKAKVLQLRKEVQNAEKLLDDATEVVRKQGGDTEIFKTSAVKIPQSG